MCSDCGGILVIIYWLNPDTGKQEPNYGMCVGCLKCFPVQ